MKSKPSYDSLSYDDSARQHIFIAEGDGLNRVARVLAGTRETKAVQIFSLGAHVWPEFPGEATEAVFESSDELNRALAIRLTSTGMDVAAYVSGCERFVWDIFNLLVREGMPTSRIHMEAAGSVGRRVYCVHCTTMNTEVTETISVCDGCGAHLSVRDHFSRPLGAYMGVRVDAEVPGDIPESRRLCA